MIFEANNLQYSGFESISVKSSIQTLSDSFSLTCNNRWLDGSLKAGDECRILDSAENPLLDGYVDILNPTIGASMTIMGRDKAGDLIDSNYASGTGEFVGLTLKEIITALCQPFGIIVTGETGSKINRFRYGLDQSVSDIIRTLVSRQGYLCNSDGSGDLVIERAGATTAPFSLVEGVNILQGSVVLDASRLHSSYKSLGQNYDNNVINSTFTGLSKRHRPRTTIDTGSIQIQDAQTRSEWIGRTSDGSAQRYSVTVANVQDVRPNTLIYCDSPTLGVNDSLLITDVVRLTDKSGSTTSLNLANPYIFGLDAVNNTYL
jgi:prophage tail gpP-like protein